MPCQYRRGETLVCALFGAIKTPLFLLILCSKEAMLTQNLQVRSYKGQRSLLHDPGFEQDSMHCSRSKACSDVQSYHRGTVLSGCNISSLQLPDSL